VVLSRQTTMTSQRSQNRATAPSRDLGHLSKAVCQLYKFCLSGRRLRCAKLLSAHRTVPWRKKLPREQNKVR
jgi:hypothetical protein